MNGKGARLMRAVTVCARLILFLTVTARSEPQAISPSVQRALADPATTDTNYNLHYQATVIDQGHFRFHAPYTGTNSQLPATESDTSVTSTIFVGWRPLQNTELFLDPEMSGGQGMSGALGIAGFPNGETYRIGNPRPVVKTARLYLQQIFGLGGGTERAEDGPNQIAGPLPENRITVWAGKFGMMDWFDNNAYSHDPRAQFMNWDLANSGAWDYPADTYGYTWGLATEYHTPTWAVRGGAVAEPKIANQADMDRRIGRAHGFTAEVEHQSLWENHPGTFRLLLFCNEARMGNYDRSIALGQQTNTTPNIAQTRAYGHTKYGFTTSDDLRLTDHLGAFSRLSWDDGRNETWAYDETDGSAALGADWNPAQYGRPKDHWGVAQLVNVLSAPHRRYLAAGGLGFMLGDGALHYGPEFVTETYYRIQINQWFQLSPDAQLVINPGFNRNRGPVPVWGLRVHTEF